MTSQTNPHPEGPLREGQASSASASVAVPSAKEGKVASPGTPEGSRASSSSSPPTDRKLSAAERNSATDPLKFLLILLQLAVISFVVYAFKIEGRTFGELTGLVAVGFAVHYWLPYRWKKWFFVLFSAGGAFAIIPPLTATAVLVSTLVLYAIVRLPIGYWLRVGAIALIAAACLWFRNYDAGSVSTNAMLSSFWPVFGGIFMFRMMIYLYDMRNEKARGGFLDYLTYFLILPNYYFLLFPIIDYQTMRSTYYNGEFHKQAQEGIRWIARGVAQLMIYRLIYHLRPYPSPEEVTSFGGLVVAMVLTYLLYLRLSGQYHIIVGMMRLFGFNLPETHRRFLFAESFTDFWRRINIYWKDFMVKLVYYPVYFRIRKFGDLKAAGIATFIVFVVTWVLHAYQFYWLSGTLLLEWHDLLFWTILGVLVLINVILETKAQSKRGRGAAPVIPNPAVRYVKIAATFVTITVLWSMWNAKSLTQWLDMLTYWKVG